MLSPPLSEAAASQPAQKEAVAQAAKPDRSAIRAELKDLSEEAAASVTVLQRMRADLDQRIKATEAEIREPFDVAVSGARPVSGLVPQAIGRELAIKIGDADHPLSILYVAAWYGSEALIVLLVCAIVVPWVLRLWGEKAPADQVKTGFKKIVHDALGPRVTAGVVNAVAAMTVGAATLAGVAAAANQDVSIAPVTVVDRVVKTNVAGPELPPAGDPPNAGDPRRRRRARMRSSISSLS